MRLYHYTVTGCGSFPFKLLAADRAWPASADNAEVILYACPTQAPRHSLTLASHQHPTTRAWADAGWPVSKVD